MKIEDSSKNLMQLTLLGFWFCDFCDKIVDRVQRGNKFVCIRCGKNNELRYIKGLD